MGGVVAGVAEAVGIGAAEAGGAALAGEVAAGALTAGEAIAAGASVADLVAAGATTSELIAAGASTAELISAGASVPELMAAGASTGELLSAGVSAESLAQAGVSAEALSSAGATAEELSAAAPYFEAAAQGTNPIPFQLADGSMGSIQGGNILDAAGNVIAEGGSGGFGLGDLAKGVGYAKTGAQLIGGFGQLAGAQQARQAGKQISGLQADPYAQYRPQAASQLQNLLANPSTITSTPGYQFNLAQGMNALQANQAAQGRLVSGGALLQSQQWGQQYATSQLQQQEDMLAKLSGATQSPATGATSQAGLAYGGVGANALSMQQYGAGAANVLNPLQTLYSQYNTPSPTPG